MTSGRRSLARSLDWGAMSGDNDSGAELAGFDELMPKTLANATVDHQARNAGGLRGPYLGDRHRAELLQSLLAPASPNPLYFIDVAVPITAPDGRVTGVLAAHLYWRWAAHMVASIVPGKSARQQIDVFLVDQKGHISYPDRVPGATQVPAALSLGAPQVLDSWAEGGRYLSVALPVPEAWPASPLGWPSRNSTS